MPSSVVGALVTSALQMGQYSDLPKLTSGRSQSLNRDLSACRAHCLQGPALHTASSKSLSDVNTHVELSINLYYIL